jgi:hypothetical protein
MRLWREIRNRGASILRDGVYLLPARADLSDAFAALAAAVVAAGGAAHVLRVNANAEQAAEWQALFERAKEYGELLTEIQQQSTRLKRATVDAARTACRELEEQFATLAATDYFAGASREQVAQALADLRAQIERRASPDEPQAQAGRIEQLARDDYRGRVWSTRRNLWVDRVASAWLIRRFIDTEARFVWIAKPDARPKRAIGFDYDGAQFTHRAGRVTFEVLTASFGLEEDAALTRLGRVVHALDVGGVPQPEASGLETILGGLRATCADDDAFLAAASTVFDACYASFNKRAPH